MSYQRDPDRRRDPEQRPIITDGDDSAWGPILGVVIIAGLAAAAIFFFVNRGDNTPTRQTMSTPERAPITQPATPPARSTPQQ